MAGKSISKILKRRKILAGLTVILSVPILMLVLIFLNEKTPQKTEASFSQDSSTDTYTFNTDTYIINSDGTVLGSDLREPNETWTYNITNKNVVVNNSRLIFSGGNIRLKSLRINGGEITHVGPGRDQTHFFVPTMNVSGIFEGWFRTSQQMDNVLLHFDDNARLYWAEDSENFTATFQPVGGYVNNQAKVGVVKANTWYHFKVYWINGVDNRALYFKNSGTGPAVANDNFYLKRNSGQGQVSAYYMNEGNGSCTDDANIGMSDSCMTNRFSNGHLIAYTEKNLPLTETNFSKYYWQKPFEQELHVSRELALTIDEQLTLENGGKITADEKGYLGGRWFKSDPSPDNAYHRISDELYFPNDPTHPDVKAFGWGPGGGFSVIPNLSTRPSSVGSGISGGGGSAGSGRVGDYKLEYSSLWGGNTSGSQSYDRNYGGKLQYGSGGGGIGLYGTNSDHSYGNGGDGGGLIEITANRIVFEDSASKISANGGDGNMLMNENYVGVGGGGGGQISLDIVSFVYHGADKIDATVNGVGGGGTGIIESSIGLFQISADGGHGDGDVDYGGGGGWIINKKGAINATVKKQLYPILRSGSGSSTLCNADNPTSNDNATNPNCFNPYALQGGDIIKIVLTVAGIPTGSTIELRDKPLSGTYDGNPKVCTPVNNSTYPATGSPTISGTEIYWPNTEEGDEFYYYCQVSN